METKAIAFFNILYKEEYLNIIIDKWIKDTSYTFSNIVDFLTFWFEAWAVFAPLDFALNWHNGPCGGSISFFDIRHKKPDPEKKSPEEIVQFGIDNVFLVQLRDVFCIPYQFIRTDVKAHRDLCKRFVNLIENNLFTQDRMNGKDICFYKFRYNCLCKLDRIIVTVFKRLKQKFYEARPKEEYILFDEFVYNYRRKVPYIDGLFTTNKIV